MQITVDNGRVDYIKLAQVPQSEDLFALPPETKQKIEQVCDATKKAFQQLSEISLKKPPKSFTPGHVNELLERFYLGIRTYRIYRLSNLADSLFHALLFSHLHALPVDFARGTGDEPGIQPLPYEQMEATVWWPDYASYFYCNRLTSSSLQRFFSLSQTMQNSLNFNEGQRIYLTLLELRALFSYQPTQQAESSRSSPEDSGSEISFEVVPPAQGPVSGMGIDDSIYYDALLSEAESREIAQQESELVKRTVPEFSSVISSAVTPYSTTDAGHLLSRVTFIESLSPFLKASFVIPRIDETVSSLANQALENLRSLRIRQQISLRVRQQISLRVRQQRRQRAGNDPTFYNELVALTGGDKNLFRRVTDEFPLSLEEDLETIRILLKEIERSRPVLLYGEKLKALIDKVSSVMHQNIASREAHDGFFKPLLSILATKNLHHKMRPRSEAEEAVSSTERSAQYLEPSFELMLDAYSALSSLLPQPPKAKVQQEISPSQKKPKRAKARRVTRRRRQANRSHKTHVPKKPPPHPKLPISPLEERVEEETPPSPPPCISSEDISSPVSKEAKTLARLLQELPRINRHRRTFDRPEFSENPQEQALHYLPFKLVQLLLSKAAFIESYVQWKKNDLAFSGNHSVSATLLCNDRRSKRVYVGELSIGITPNGMVYHVFLNPFANPLENRKTLKKSVVHHPPTDLQDAAEGFAPPIGECQVSYNKKLGAIDALDIKEDRLYRVFARTNSMSQGSL